MKRKKKGLVKKAEVERLIEHYKPFLGLSAWSHTLTMDMSSQGDAVAAVIAEPDCLMFSMVFAPRCFAATVAQYRSTTLEASVLHELLHVALWPLVAGLAGLAKDADADQIARVRQLVEEPLVDPLSRTLAKYLPKLH